MKDLKYVNPFTDYGFKRLFGDENNTDILIDFLNGVLKGKAAPIKKIYFLDKEQLGSNVKKDKYIYDLHCESSNGERFVVEMQKNKKPDYITRSAVYGSNALIAQSNRSEERYNFKKVFIISILDFCPTGWEKYKPKFRFDMTLKEDEFPEIEFDGIRYVYFVMKHFTKEVHELEGNYEKWLYLLRSMKTIKKHEEAPEGYVNAIFRKFLEKAELANLSDAEQTAYAASLMHYKDQQDEIKAGREEGRAEERAKAYQGKLEIAKNFLAQGVDPKMISQATGLSLKELAKL